MLVFSDPARGQRHGYVEDGWRDDGTFHYTGEGQEGDQKITAGNKAIAQHKIDGRAVRVFAGSAGTIRYMGEFSLAEDPAWYWTDAPESIDAPSRGEVIRQVVVFRLEPLDASRGRPSNPLDALPNADVADVPVEKQNTEKAFVNPSGREYEIERREQKLVLAYKQYLERKGSDISRQLIRPPGEAKPLFTDLYDKTRNNLIEAKGVATRSAMRMAIGQLLVYRRFLDPGARPAVLVPARPRQDLEDLLREQGIATVWLIGKAEFADNADGRFS